LSVPAAPGGRGRRAAVLIGMVLLVVGLVLTQATLVVGLIVSVMGFLSMVGASR
jgi:hypothetical protein